MWSSLVEYHRPVTMDNCVRLLSRQFPRTVPLAGGTWLMAHRESQVEAVVDLSALNLAFIKSSARRLRLGAMTTLQTLIDTPSVQCLANGLLKEALYKSASHPIRNVATLGGTIVVGNSTSELCLALLVLDAQVVIHASTVRVFLLSDFLANPTECLPPGGVLTEIIIPKVRAGIGAALAEVRRTPNSQPIVNAAALVSQVGNLCRVARLALGGVEKYPFRLSEIEGMISYKKINPELCDRVAEAIRSGIYLPPVGKSLSEYQREMASLVVARALHNAYLCVEKE